MKKKNKNKINLIGAIVFVSGLCFNLQYAWNNYDVTNNSLHIEVLAQTGSFSGGGGTSGGVFGYKKTKKDCVYEGKAQPFSVVNLGPSAFTHADHTGYWRYIDFDGEVLCEYGGIDPCNPKNCPSYPGKTS